MSIVVQELIKTLPAAIWALTGTLFWLCALATYVVVFEQRRRKRTDSQDDDWR
jgi:hypothetical protein